jgi:peptidyl-prolyl cis-trans isomerase D
MATLGKIRSKGAILATIIGLALFAFIAEEMFRSCESARNDQRQQIGEVLGEKIDVQEFQKLIDEYQEVIKVQQGQENLNEDQLNQVKDMVWNTYVQTKIIEGEAKKLGLTVTDEEMQNILTQGTNPMLAQSPFINQQTGRFDVNQLKKFLAEYKAQQTANPQLAQQYQTIYRYWTFLEKTLRQQLLAQKYQSLFAHSLLTNSVEAKASFKEENEESKIELASFPYADIDDSKVKIEETDLKAKYDEMKPRFRQYVESRDIKYVDIKVEASATDRAELQKQFATYATDLATAEDPADVVRKSTSLVAYLGVPVTKSAFPTDIAAKIDSMAVGQTSPVFETKGDNTLNVVKLISKQSLPDSVQFRQIQVAAETAEAAHKRADSIYAAINGGADFEVIAKKYGQTGEKTWMTTAQYQNASSMDATTKDYIQSLYTMSSGELKNVTVEQGNIIVQVLDGKSNVDKYQAAVIKKTIDFSRNTYSAAYNKFASFVSANRTGDDIAKNAQKNGYTVLERKDVTTSAHNLAGIRATREALKWVFASKEGEVSPMYECGDNDHLLVVVLDKINKVGYRDMKDVQVREMVKSEVLKDKKGEMLLAKVNGVKSIDQAKAKGAKVSTVEQVTFSSPVFIATTGTSENPLAGAVSATAKGAFCAKPVVGNAGVYVYKVLAKTMRPGKYDAKAQENKLRQKAMQAAGNFMNELYINAKVVDNRYLFF